MKALFPLLALFVGLCQVPLRAQIGSHDLFVAIDGNDAWSGRLANPNADRTDGPLATVHAAATALRRLHEHSDSRSPVTVWIRGGIYRVESPLVFTPADSGPVTYSAYPGEQPIFDAGNRITNWHEQKVNGVMMWVADVRGIVERTGGFRSLFVNGQRRQRARLPRQGFYRIASVPGLTLKAKLFDGTSSFRVTPGEVSNWRNLGDVEIRVYHYWTDERMPIESVDEKTGLVTCTRRSIFALRDSFKPQWAEYFAENVFEGLTEPGEWYLDRKEAKLYYIPMPGETMRATEVVAAGVFEFLRLQGVPEAGRLVTGLTFRGLTFRYSDWIQPDVDGTYFDPYVAEQNRRPEDSEKLVRALVEKGVKLGSGPQSASYVPGAISLEGARDIAFIDNQIEHVGYWGISLLDGCRNIRIEGNTFSDLGAGGVKIDGANYPSDPRDFSGNNHITDNIVRSGGRVFVSAAGILITHGFGNLVSHNEISDFYQSGIAVGWDWTRNTQVSRDNIIEYNHVFHLGQKMSDDMGGVYILGVQPGTIVRNNLIHDIQQRTYGGWGIYTDAMTAHVVIENNIVYDVSAQPNYVQGVGTVNREITIRNNIFALGGEGIAYLPETYEEKKHNAPGYAATYERNVFLSDGKPFFEGDAGPASEHLHNDLFLSDLNLFWDVSGRPLIVEKKVGTKPLFLKWAEWRDIGSDIHSIVADPQFRDWRKGDFTLAPHSPAFSLGFQPIDIADVGPRPEGKRCQPDTVCH